MQGYSAAMPVADWSVLRIFGKAKGRVMAERVSRYIVFTATGERDTL